MEAIWRLLSLQNFNECCAIKELRKSFVWKQRKNWESAQVSRKRGFARIAGGRRPLATDEVCQQHDHGALSPIAARRFGDDDARKHSWFQSIFSERALDNYFKAGLTEQQ
jgi:hypothetical protein